MSVIAELQVAPEEFELGVALDLSVAATAELETMVPLGQHAVPFFRVRDEHRQQFEEHVLGHRSVSGLHRINEHDSDVLYALEWDSSRDTLFSSMQDLGAQLLNAKGTADRWFLEIRFPSHDALSQFHEMCESDDVDLVVDRVYNPTKPGAHPWFGLTSQQRETLMRAVEGGYYSIPRQISTKQLAEEFDISDQAVTERLRRAIVALVENTLMVANQTPAADDDD